MDLELYLHRKAEREASFPHITRRLVQDHLGRQWYVNRIEVTLFSEQFYHVKSETKGDKEDLCPLLITMLTAIRNGRVLNLQHWKRVEYAFI